MSLQEARTALSEGIAVGDYVVREAFPAADTAEAVVEYVNDPLSPRKAGNVLLSAAPLLVPVRMAKAGDDLPGGGGAGRQADKVAGNTVAARNVTTFGPNALGHFRSHSQHIRETARKLGIEIPKGPTKPATLAAMKGFIEQVVQQGVRKTGKFKEIADAEWYKLGDAIVVRRPDGEWLSFLDYSLESPLSKLWDSMH